MVLWVTWAMAPVFVSLVTHAGRSAPAGAPPDAEREPRTSV